MANSHGALALAGAKTHTNPWNSSDTGTALSTGDGFEYYLQGAPKTSVGMAPNESATGTIPLQKQGL